MTQQLRQYIRIGILLLLLLIPNIYAIFNITELNCSVAKQLGYMVVVIVGLLLPALFLKARTYFIFEGVFTLLLAPIEIATIYLNHATVSPAFLNFIVETDMREATELLLTNLIPVSAYLAVLALYIVLTIRTENRYLFPRIVKRIVLYSLPLLFAVGFAVFYRYARIYDLQNFRDVAYRTTDLMLMKFYKIYPYDIYLNGNLLWERQREIKHYTEQLQSFSFGIEEKTDDEEEMYVLVIGETARSKNFSLNGYERQTNPLLEQQTNLISYPHAYAQANLTGKSVPHICSPIPVQHRDSLYTRKTVQEAFVEAGFSSVIVSNQREGLYIERIMRTATWTINPTKDLDYNAAYDIELVHLLDSALTATPAKKHIVTLHCAGSHWRYDERYPQEFCQFQPAMSKTFNIDMLRPQNKDILLNSYDNSLLYTDYVLDSLINYLRGLHRSVLLVYTSDHGENLYDDDRQLVLHGTYCGSEYEANVPFLVWYSDEYKRTHELSVQQLLQHRQQHFSSAVIFHTLLQAADIYTATDDHKSLTSPLFLEPDTIYFLTGDERLDVRPLRCEM